MTVFIELESPVRRLNVFFFSQAEDGIRDLTVTGVQTCALPIFVPRERTCKLIGEYERFFTLYKDTFDRKHVLSLGTTMGQILGDAPVFETFYAGGMGSIQIGRASCRERV